MDQKWRLHSPDDHKHIKFWLLAQHDNVTDGSRAYEQYCRCHEQMPPWLPGIPINLRRTNDTKGRRYEAKHAHRQLLQGFHIGGNVAVDAAAAECSTCRGCKAQNLLEDLVD